MPRDFAKQNDRIKNSYDRFTMTFPKGKKDTYRNYAESQGLSLNAYINKLIANDMGEEEDNEPQGD